jgi:hypothetical protein
LDWIELNRIGEGWIELDRPNNKLGSDWD